MSWAVPNPEAIAALVEFVGARDLLEIGAGLGLWARLIANEGVHITATDINKDRATWFKPWSRPFFPIAPLGHLEALKTYPNHQTLMLCWPPYSEPMAAEALDQFTGEQFIFIGEGEGGCTATDKLWEILGERFDLVKEVDIPQWAGIHDRMIFYSRRVTVSERIRV